MLKNNLEHTLDQLLAIGPRAPGSWKELEAAEFINEEFQSFGYDSRIKTFSAASHNATEAFLEVNGKKKSCCRRNFPFPANLSAN